MVGKLWVSQLKITAKLPHTAMERVSVRPSFEPKRRVLCSKRVVGSRHSKRQRHEVEEAQHKHTATRTGANMVVRNRKIRTNMLLIASCYY